MKEIAMPGRTLNMSNLGALLRVSVKFRVSGFIKAFSLGILIVCFTDFKSSGPYGCMVEGGS